MKRLQKLTKQAIKKIYGSKAFYALLLELDKRAFELISEIQRLTGVSVVITPVGGIETEVTDLEKLQAYLKKATEDLDKNEIKRGSNEYYNYMIDQLALYYRKLVVYVTLWQLAHLPLDLMEPSRWLHRMQVIAKYSIYYGDMLVEEIAKHELAASSADILSNMGDDFLREVISKMDDLAEA